MTETALTSSLLDCFARLALSVEAVSLMCTWEAWVSRAGRGMPEGMPEGVSTNCARAGWLRFLGFPRMVPVCDMAADGPAASLAGEMGAVRGRSQSQRSVVQSGVLCGNVWEDKQTRCCQLGVAER